MNTQGQDAAQALLDFVNTSPSQEDKAFAEYITTRGHRTLQQRVMGLMLECIDQWAADRARKLYDARNEATVTLAAQIKDTFGEDWEIVRRLPFI